MRYGFVAAVVLSCVIGCAHGEQEKPSGVEMFDALFRSIDYPLARESRCQMTTTPGNDRELLLRDYVLLMLSMTYENERNVSLSSKCSSAKSEEGSDGIIDVWDCELNLVEYDHSGEFLTSATIMFAVPKEGSDVLPGSLRCF